jgi:lipopolysaccharide transport system permease protein
VTVYKQTVLGPLWYLIQPLFTPLLYHYFLIIWLNQYRNRTLFNLAGITVWNYLQLVLTIRQNFKKMRVLLVKVFSSIIMPLSVVISNLLKFGIQFLFHCIYVLLYLRVPPCLNGISVLFPFLIVEMGILGLGRNVYFSW